MIINRSNELRLILISSLLLAIGCNSSVNNNSGCDLQVVSSSKSPNLRLIAKHKKATCEKEKKILHTLYISPVNYASDEPVIEMMLHRINVDTQETVSDPTISLHWISDNTLEVEHPNYVHMVESTILNGVNVVNRVSE